MKSLHPQKLILLGLLFFFAPCSAQATRISFDITGGEFYWNSNKDALVSHPLGSAFYDSDLHTLALDIIMTGSVGGFNGRQNADRGYTNSRIRFDIDLTGITMVNSQGNDFLVQGDANLQDNVRNANALVTQGVHTGISFPLLQGPMGRDLLQNASLTAFDGGSLLLLSGITTAFRGEHATDHPVGPYSFSLSLGAHPSDSCAVPEPTTAALLAVGAFGGYRRRRLRNQQALLNEM